MIKAIRGRRDLLPPESGRWQWVKPVVVFSSELLPVNLPPMSYLDDQDNLIFFLDFKEDAIISGPQAIEAFILRLRQFGHSRMVRVSR